MYEIRLMVFSHLITLANFSRRAFFQTVSKADVKSTNATVVFSLSWNPASISVVKAQG